MQGFRFGVESKVWSGFRNCVWSSGTVYGLESEGGTEQELGVGGLEGEVSKVGKT